MSCTQKVSQFKLRGNLSNQKRFERYLQNLQCVPTTINQVSGCNTIQTAGCHATQTTSRCQKTVSTSCTATTTNNPDLGCQTSTQTCGQDVPDVIEYNPYQQNGTFESVSYCSKPINRHYHTNGIHVQYPEEHVYQNVVMHLPTVKHTVMGDDHIMMDKMENEKPDFSCPCPSGTKPSETVKTTFSAATPACGTKIYSTNGCRQ